MAKITGIYVPINADLKQLRSDMGQAKQIITESANSMTNSLNGALSGDQAKRGVNSLVTNLSALSMASKNVGKDFSNIGVDLKQFQSVTGTSASQFAKLQGQLLQTQAAKAQEKALRDIAKQAGLTTKEIQALGKQFGLSKTQIDNVASSTNTIGGGFSNLLGYISPVIIALGAAAKAAEILKGEFVYGLKAVESYGMSIAQSTALITTFSQKAKDGDLAGAFLEANNYAKELVPALEMIDSKTIASGKDLQAMSETFIANGVLLEINNKKQVESFTAVANALAILTQGQNKDIQMRQEIRGLLDGEIRSQDKLGMLLKAQIPDIEKQLVKWREKGTVLENLGGLLQGFSASTGLIEDQWATVGSTMETIHTRILRGMMEPVFDDLIGLAKDLNKSLMDAEGNLTPLARGIIKLFNDGYDGAKSFFDESERGWAKMLFDINLVTAGARIFNSVLGYAKGMLEDYGSTGLEKTKNDLAEIEQKIKDVSTRGDDWWEVSLFKDPGADKKYLTELNTKAETLRLTITDIHNESARELGKSGGAVSKAAPKIAPPPPDSTGTTGGGSSRASDMNAAVSAQLGYLKAAEEKKAAAIKAAIDIEQQANENAYDIGIKTYRAYLDTKQRLTEDSLQTEISAKQKEFDDAKAAAGKLSPITDKDGNSRPDKDLKAQYDALKKVEMAEKSLIEAQGKLTTAQSEGSKIVRVALREEIDLIKQYKIEFSGRANHFEEAERIRQTTIDYTTQLWQLQQDAIEGVAGAQEALAGFMARGEKDLKIAKSEDKFYKADVDNSAFGSSNEFDSITSKYTDMYRGLQLIEDEFGKQSTEAKKARWGAEVDMARDSIDAISLALLQGNESQFNAGKALAISMAIINGALSVSKALTLAYPMNFAVAGMVGAAAGTQVSAIMSQQYQGRAEGGPVTAGQTYIVNENRATQGPEYFTPKVAGTITPANKMNGQTTNNSITQVINVVGRIDRRTSTQLASDAARKQRVANARFG